MTEIVWITVIASKRLEHDVLNQIMTALCIKIWILLLEGTSSPLSTGHSFQGLPK